LLLRPELEEETHLFPHRLLEAETGLPIACVVERPHSPLTQDPDLFPPDSGTEGREQDKRRWREWKNHNGTPSKKLEYILLNGQIIKINVYLRLG
jgi:hypothetical protein